MLSVIIPTFQRRDLVVSAVRSLAAQTLPGEAFEVLVVVDGSTDGTVAAVESIDSALVVKVLYQENRGAGGARNAGIESAGGDWLLFLDDDMVLEQDFLELLDAASMSDADICLPRVRIGDWVPDTIPSREARVWDTEAHEAMSAGTFHLYDVIYRAAAVRRSLLDRVGGFDEASTANAMWGNEDIEMSHRLLEAGATVRYEPRALASTDCIVDPEVWLKRYRQLGRSDVALVAKHPALADEVYGRLFRHSRIHRLVAPIVLKAPWIVTVTTPARSLVALLVRRGVTAAVPARSWFTVRAAEYWRAVGKAGGGLEAKTQLARIKAGPAS
jgi:glycosyltransferase involved in cell wall biosynthesis